MTELLATRAAAAGLEPCPFYAFPWTAQKPEVRLVEDRGGNVTGLDDTCSLPLLEARFLAQRRKDSPVEAEELPFSERLEGGMPFHSRGGAPPRGLMLQNYTVQLILCSGCSSQVEKLSEVSKMGLS